MFTELINEIKKLDLIKIEKIIKLIKNASKQKRTIFFIGNGGSASTASHMAADLGKNTRLSPKPKTISLCDNLALITAIANDIDYANVFSEQLRQLSQKNDILFAISGSGNSQNIVKAIKIAKKKGLVTIGFLGFNGGALLKLVDIPILVTSKNYGVIESAHSAIQHYIIEQLKK